LPAEKFDSLANGFPWYGRGEASFGPQVIGTGAYSADKFGPTGFNSAEKSHGLSPTAFSAVIFSSGTNGVNSNFFYDFAQPGEFVTLH
jgi:hypothetical protein